MVKQYGLKNPPPDVPRMVFVLDYIQLVEMEGSDGFDRVKEITKISRKIMSLKKQLKCPWLVNAQMNRNIETAERDRKPVLSDLKDCGALEQDCDLALFTYRTPRKELERVPETGGPSQEEVLEAVCQQPGFDENGKAWPWSQVPYRVDLVVPKNRFGPTGDAQMVFCKNLCRFEDWHLWKVKHGVESLKAGESKKLFEPPEELK
jgi:replicative DNA helicase